MPVDRNDLAGLYVTHEFGTHHLESTGFAADDIAVSQLADRKGPQTVFVTAGIDAVSRHHQKRERSFEHIERLDDRIDTGPVVVAYLLFDKMGEHFAVRSGLEKTALVLQVVAQQIRIDDISVVGQCEITRIMMEQKRLYILRSAASGRRVADMTDSHVTRKSR